MSGPLAILPILLALAGRALADDNTSSSDVPLVERILHYSPSRPLAIIAGLLYIIAAVSLGNHIRARRDWWGICLPIGALCMAIGYFVRFAETYGSLDDSLGIYIIMDLLILCAPATFLAFNYIVYGRTIVQCIGREHSIIRPERVARIFVISDISTFFLQASGGGLTAMNSLAKLGNDIVLVGLILQALSYVFFIFVAVRAHRSVVRSSPRSSVHKEAWWRVLWVLYFSSIFVLIRCIYRIVEFAQGYDGYLVTHEAYFYCLDALPLLIAISVYIPFWPSKYISPPSEEYKMPLGSSTSV